MSNGLATLEERAAWERMTGEPDRAWAAFVIYRDLRSQRSYENVRQALDKLPSYTRQIQRWASRYRWRDRVFAFDVEDDRQERERMEQRKAAMDLAHERISNRMLEAIEARLQGGTYTMGDGTEIQVEALDPNRLDPYRLVALLGEAVRTGRLAHGEATEMIRGIFMLSTTDVARIVEGIMEVAYDFWGTDSRWGMFVERVKAIPNR